MTATAGVPKDDSLTVILSEPSDRGRGCHPEGAAKRRPKDRVFSQGHFRSLTAASGSPAAMREDVTGGMRSFVGPAAPGLLRMTTREALIRMDNDNAFQDDSGGRARLRMTVTAGAPQDDSEVGAPQDDGNDGDLRAREPLVRVTSEARGGRSEGGDPAQERTRDEGDRT